jgi:hypothetical protein
LTGQIEQLTRDYSDATNRLAFLRLENERLNLNNRELLKLRGEVPGLRADAKELARLKAGNSKNGDVSAEESLLDRVRLIKERLEQTPKEKNPELQFLTEQDWLTVAAECKKLDSDNDFRAAFSDLRARGEGRFLDLAKTALGKYLAANNGQFPTDFAQLKTCFENPPIEEILQRYQVVPASSIPQANVSGSPGDWVITLKSPDSNAQSMLSRTGVAFSSQADSQEMAVLAPAMKAALDAAPTVNGSKRIRIDDLRPYLTTPEEQAAYQSMMERRGARTNY